MKRKEKYIIQPTAKKLKWESLFRRWKGRFKNGHFILFFKEIKFFCLIALSFSVFHSFGDYCSWSSNPLSGQESWQEDIEHGSRITKPSIFGLIFLSAFLFSSHFSVLCLNIDHLFYVGESLMNNDEYLEREILWVARC